MKLSDLKHNFKETPNGIHTMVENEVQNQIKRDESVRKNPSNLVWIAVTAGCVCAALLIFAIVNDKNDKITSSQLNEKNIVYATPGNAEQKTQDKICEVIPEIGYTPEEMDWFTFTSLVSKNDATNPQLILDVLVLDDGKLSYEFPDGEVTLKYQTDDGRDIECVKLNEPDKDGFSQYAVSKLYKEKRVIVFKAKDSLDTFEFGMVVSEYRLVDNGNTLASDKFSKWSDYVSGKYDNYNPFAFNQVPDSIGDVRLKVLSFGEKLEISENIWSSPKSIEVYDGIEVLKAENISDELKASVDENGKIKTNNISYYKYLNGVESVLVKEEKVDQKLVVITFDYTNNGTTDMKHVLFAPTLQLLEHRGNCYYAYNDIIYLTPENEEWDTKTEAGIASPYKWVYASVTTDNEDEPNYIDILAGETVSVTIAWVINESDLENMYVDVSGQGTGFEINEFEINNGVFK